MYIIGKGKDYYDSVGYQYGIDKSIIYKRTLTELEANGEFEKPIKHLISASPFRRIDLDFPNYTNFDMVDEWYLIGFCGKIYVCLKLTWGKSKPRWVGDYFPEDTFQFLYSNEFIPILEEEIRNKVEVRPSKWLRDPDYNHVIETAKLLETMDYSDLFFKYKTPCFVIKILRDQKPILNPLLKDYEFFKVKDAFTAFQEIQQFISGVIGIDSNEPIVTDDKYKILAAGFDLKTSFRKDAGKIKPRKNK